MRLYCVGAGFLRASSSIFAISLALASAAHADPILFDPDGPGGNGTISVEQFDYQPGNGVFVHLGPADSAKVNGPFQYLFQARLGNFLDTNSNVIPVAGLNQPGGFEITAVFAFDGVANGAAAPTVYSLAANQNLNYFRLYYDANAGTQANDLAGTGFDDGTLILSGALSQADGSFSIIPTVPLPLFDGFGPDNYGGKPTLVSAGGADLTVSSLAANPSFFITSPPALQLHLANSSNVTPFDEVDPSQVFQPNLVNHVPLLGGTNGRATDFQVQSDANGSFVTPEPSSLVLLALAAIGWVCTLRRKLPLKRGLMNRISNLAAPRIGTVSVVAIAVFLVLAPHSFAQPSINYPNFSSVAGLTLNGSPAPTSVGSGLRMTNDRSQVSSAFVTSLQDVTHNFHAIYQFTLTDPHSPIAGNGADGITFVVQADPRGASALGDGGNGIGYSETFNDPPTGHAIINSIAVTLRTYTSNFFQIDVNAAPGNVHYQLATSPLYVQQGNVPNIINQMQTVTVDYAAAGHALTVRLNGNSIGLDNKILPNSLASILGSGNGYFGFTSATGADYATATVNSFVVVPEPSSLTLTCLALGGLLWAARRSTEGRRTLRTA